MKQYKAIIYDIDGTLLDTVKMNMIPLLKIVEEETGEVWSYEKVLKFATYPGLKVMEEIGVKDVETVYQRWVKYVNEYEDGATPFPGVVELLEHFDGKIKQAIVSSKTTKQYEIDFVSNGFGRFITTAILAEDTKKHKPDPEPLQRCLDRLQLQASEAIYIGDGLTDYLAAKAIGMDFGYASWGSFTHQGIENPEYIFNSPLEIKKQLFI